MAGSHNKGKRIKSHIPFIKIEGNGNDFIFIHKKNIEKTKITSTKIKKMCHRNFGIGADGVVIYDLKSKKNFDFTIFNSDGSRAKTCGNALRCLGLLAFEQKKWDGKCTVNIFSSGRKSPIARLIGIKKNIVTIDMGENTESKKIALEFFPQELKKNLQNACFLEVPNPHVICLFSKKFEIEEFLHWSRWLQEHLPKITMQIPKSNISFLSPRGKKAGQYDLLVYERGAGMTLCCGSAAVASSVILRKLLDKNHFDFQLLGGKVEVKMVLGKWHLTGKAQIVFEGWCSLN